MLNRPLVSPALMREPKERLISIVAYHGAEILDITGPFEVFALASLAMQREGLSKAPVYQVEVLAARPGPVTTMTGLQIIANRAYGEVQEQVDTLLIPGGTDIQQIVSDAALLQWVRSMALRVKRVASVCTGAFLLAESGLLDRRRATTHWNYCRQLASNYPSVAVEPDQIFVRDDFLYTSGGITSGIDLALALVEEDWGRELALFVARYLVMFLKRPGGQSQFSAYHTNEAAHRPDLRDLQAWIIDHPAEDLRVDRLAERIAMSPRNFARLFLAETGMTPAKFVEMVRLDAARHYLEDTMLPVESVADKSGFCDSERMRRSFLRQLGVNPQSYRERFSRSNILVGMETTPAKLPHDIACATKVR